MSGEYQSSWKDYLSSAFERIKRVSSARLLIMLIVFISVSVLGAGIFERHHSEAFDSSFNVFYWLIVTSTTTGYGDITPVTFPGKALNIIVMSPGLVFIEAARAQSKSPDEKSGWRCGKHTIEAIMRISILRRN